MHDSLQFVISDPLSVSFGLNKNIIPRGEGFVNLCLDLRLALDLSSHLSDPELEGCCLSHTLERGLFVLELGTLFTALPAGSRRCVDDSYASGLLVTTLTSSTVDGEGLNVAVSKSYAEESFFHPPSVSDHCSAGKRIPSSTKAVADPEAT